MSELRIREANEEDAAALVDLLVQLHPRYPGDPAQAAELMPVILRNPGRTLLVADRGTQLVGTADVLVVPNITHGGRPWAIVENVVVDRHARGAGVGAALLTETLRLARDAGCYMLQLLSLSHRIEAHAFYRKLGFEPVAAGFRLYVDDVAPTAADDEHPR
jgi:GNAT superfamily N-acetyltransferase